MSLKIRSRANGSPKLILQKIRNDIFRVDDIFHGTAGYCIFSKFALHNKLRRLAMFGKYAAMFAVYHAKQFLLSSFRRRRELCNLREMIRFGSSVRETSF
jgi:hypothetical protein